MSKQELTVWGPGKNYIPLSIRLMMADGETHNFQAVIGSAPGDITLGRLVCSTTGEEGVSILFKADAGEVLLVLSPESAGVLGSTLVAVGKNPGGQEN